MSRSGGYPFQSHRQRDALSTRTKIDNSVNHVVSELTDEELPIARPTPRPAAVREGREPKSVTATVLAAMAELEDLRAERSQLRREVDELKDARTRLQAETVSAAPTAGGAKTSPAAAPPPPSVDHSKELARTREQMRGMQSSLDTVLESLAELKTTVSGVNWSVSQLHSGQEDIKAHIDLAKRPVLEAVKALPVVQAAVPEEKPTTETAAEETVMTPAPIEQPAPPPAEVVEQKKGAASKVDEAKAEAAAEGGEKKQAAAPAIQAHEAKRESAASSTAEESTAGAQAAALEAAVQQQQKELGDVKAVLHEMRTMQAALLKMMEAQAADANRRQLAEYEMRMHAEKVAKAEADRAVAAAASAAATVAAAPALIAPGAAVATTAPTAPATVGQQPAAAAGPQQPLAAPVGVSPTAAVAAVVAPGEYEISILTGTGRGAGTDATVSVALRAKQGWVELPQLGASREHPKNPFEAKQTDTFVVVASQGELGELSELRIGHDGGGLLSTWQLMEVKVCHRLSGAMWLFPAVGTFGEKGIWLKKNVQKQLKAQKVKAAALPPPVVPLAAPVSGGEAGRAAASAGAHDTQPLPVLAEEDTMPHSAPEAAAAVAVPLPAPALRADSAAVRNPMLTTLEEEEEEEAATAVATATTVLVPPAVPVVRKASGQAEKAAAKTAAKAAAAAGRQSATDVLYVVQITTGGSLGAGTDADVTLELLGDKSDVWWRCPSLGASRENPANPFERNEVDTFEVWCPVQLGELVRARVGHDGSGLMSDWQLAGVAVEAVQLRKKWSFPCRSVWVKKNKPVEIAAKAVPATPK